MIALETFFSLFLRDFLEPLFLILIGGFFIFAEAFLVCKKEVLKNFSLLDFFRNSTDAANCGVAPVLGASSSFCTLNSCAPSTPCTSSASASLERSLLNRSRLVLRLSATFFFVLATILEVENFNIFLSSFSLGAYSVAIIVLALFLSLVILFFGILVPRSLGKSSSSMWITSQISRSIQWLTYWIHPLARVLEITASWFLKIFGSVLHEEIPATEKEVMQMMDEGLSHGVFNASEKEMVEGILDLDEECASSLMTPRSHLVWLNKDDDEELNWRRIAQSGYSEFPVFQGTHDHVLGMVSVKSLWANLSLAGSVKLTDVIVPALYVPSTMVAPKLIEEFREKKRYAALVVDEFGVVEGIVTLKDVVESIMGILPEREVRQYYPKIVQRADGSWQVDAMADFEEVSKTLSFPMQEEDEEENRYQSIGGFFLHHLGHIPHEGEFIVWGKFRFEVLTMKRYRIDQLKVTTIKNEGV